MNGAFLNEKENTRQRILIVLSGAFLNEKENTRQRTLIILNGAFFNEKEYYCVDSGFVLLCKWLHELANYL